MNRLLSAALPLLLITSVLAGCVNEDELMNAEVEPCADNDVACLCENVQSCIDDRTDSDGDGLFDSHEDALGTDRNNPDTDGDGVNDGTEVAAGTNPRIPHFPNDGELTYEFVELDGVDGHKIPLSVFKPAGATNTTPFPVLLQSHGFSGSRWGESKSSTASEYVARGFAVMSFDERGHGDARDDSEVTFMHPDAEVLDVITILDYIASLDWTLKELDDPTDPVVGTFGYSYGGAFQLMGSIFDDRIDAAVPEMTWNNILESLAPNGAINSGWVDLFYAAGNAQQSVVFSDEFHRGFAWATSTNEMPAGQAPEIPDLVTLFIEASPSNYPGKMTIPTQLIQGMPDTLFPLNQAVANFLELEANGAPVQLATTLGGHVLNTESLAAGTSPVPVGLQGAPGTVTACGSVQELTLQWHEKWLLDLPVDTGPKVCLTLEDGNIRTGDSWPLPETTMESHDVGGPWPMAQSVAGTEIPLLTLTAGADGMTIGGIPRLSGTITSPGADAIIYFSFQKLSTEGALEHIIDDQVRPLRIKGPNTVAIDFDMELGGIATHLLAGEQAVLIVSSIEPMYFGNSERIPSGLVLDDLILELPVLAPAS